MGECHLWLQGISEQVVANLPVVFFLRISTRMISFTMKTERLEFVPYRFFSGFYTMLKNVQKNRKIYTGFNELSFFFGGGDVYFFLRGEHH